MLLPAGWPSSVADPLSVAVSVGRSITWSGPAFGTGAAFVGADGGGFCGGFGFCGGGAESPPPPPPHAASTNVASVAVDHTLRVRALAAPRPIDLLLIRNS